MNINKNILKLSFTAFMAHLMCATVVTSHIHAKDVVSLATSTSKVKLRSNDITAKALGDLHQHIDKAGLKKIHMDSRKAAARTRELNPLLVVETDDSLGSQLHDFLLRFRVVVSLLMLRV